MRTLIYVPIIHTSADLGSLAKDLNMRAEAGLGQKVWKEHTSTVEGLWVAISAYFDSIDASGMKIFQDGMVADGELAQKIVDEGVRSGSENYRLISRLLKRGAVLIKTEDFELVMKERNGLLSITQAKSLTQKSVAFVKYRLAKNRFLAERDKFIAKRIGTALNEGETGILFIGAFHEVRKWLPGDIEIRETKDARKIREYHSLLPVCHKRRERFEELGRYLVSRVEE